MRLRALALPVLDGRKDFKISFDKDRSQSKNFFSVLIGENGTRKSQSLRGILELAYSSISSARYQGLHISRKTGTLNFWGKASDDLGGIPRKIIAVSGVATDRFPARLTSRSRRTAVDLYRYIGPRSDNNLVSRSQSVQEIARVLVSNINRVAGRIRQLKAAFELLPISKGILFEFKRIDEPDQRVWTVDSLAQYMEHTDKVRPYWSHSDLMIVIEECVDLLNSDDPVELRMDLDDVDTVGYSPDISADAFAYALEVGLITVAEPYALMPSGDSLKLSEFSSGQWHIFSSLLFVALGVEDNTLILVDEPENSLHPQWQRAYLNLFEKAISSSSGVHVVVATHSPLVASSLPPQASEVIKLKRSRYGNINSSLVSAGPYGWTADDILEEVFGLDTTRSQVFAKDMNDALNLFARGDRANPVLRRLVSKLIDIGGSLPEDDVARNVISTLKTVVFPEKQEASEE